MGPLLAGGFLTLALATLGSRALARMGLRPVQNLALRVQAINEHNLGTRIPQDTLPDELAPLASKTNEMLSRLEEAFQREKRLTSDAAHEIRTPLSSLITTLEVALRKDRTPREYKQMIAACLSSAHNLKQLTDALLLLAALDAGKVHPRAIATNMRRFLDEIIGPYKDDAKKKSLSVTTNVSVAEATLEADLLSPILNNLISNAIEYCRPGDSIAVSAYWRQPDNSLCIEVADTGPGIPKSDMEKLFYRFYRGRQQGETTAIHAGLGLAIAAKAAEAMGGRIEAESELGKGATFRVVLP
jgi:signal transduction histidine kinase